MTDDRKTIADALELVEQALDGGEACVAIAPREVHELCRIATEALDEVERLRIAHGDETAASGFAAAATKTNHKRAERLAADLKEVMTWISNWDPNFADDDEWLETKARIEGDLP